MKKLSSYKWLVLLLALASMPLIQGCDDDEDSGYSGTRTPGAWGPSEFQAIRALLNSGSTSTGSSGSGTGSGSGTTGG